MGILIFIPMLLIMYFLMIRPQQKKMREHQALIAAVKAGDEIVTSAGIYGIVSEVDGDVIWLEVAQDLELKIRRSSVEGVMGGSGTGGKSAETETAANQSPIEE
ncbi:MAG: preprotein translocase subunit YajC [Acidimicrobiales bacterium]|jgi:preprotein translocase subunit YajC|nr:preprotein translocase subunit YajC [Acidimicrobiales bacterium]